jgi:hypothetical protein
MSKWWMSITLAALGAFATTCPAQQFPFMGGGQGGQGGMPEPMPISPAIPVGPGVAAPGYPGGPGMGPLDGGMGYPGGPGMAPPGAMGPGVGFDPRQPPPGPQVDSRWYGGIGYLGLMRGKLDHSSLVQQDNFSGGVDTGNAFFGGPTLLDANELNPRLGSGFSAMVGKQWGEHAVELSGFYISQQSTFKEVAEKGSLNAPFSNPPVGFEGDNGMFLQGDVFRATLTDQLGSAELNYRKWNCGCPYVSTTCGIRFLDILERFNQYMGDDDLTVLNINGQPDRTRQATYYATAHNRILAPQLGIDFNYPLGMWLAFDLAAKGAWGVNFLETDIELQRGDGLIGRQGGHSQTVFSMLYEMGANMDVFITPHTRIRAGYNLLWVCDVGTAADQVNYDLSNSTSGNHNGNIFFHGPSVQFQWAW